MTLFFFFISRFCAALGLVYLSRLRLTHIYCHTCYYYYYHYHHYYLSFSIVQLVPGHEIIGEVISVGSEVKDLKVGTVVGLGCIAQTCGKCQRCTTDELDNICPKLRDAYLFFFNLIFID